MLEGNKENNRKLEKAFLACKFLDRRMDDKLYVTLRDRYTKAFYENFNSPNGGVVPKDTTFNSNEGIEKLIQAIHPETEDLHYIDCQDLTYELINDLKNAYEKKPDNLTFSEWFYSWIDLANFSDEIKKKFHQACYMPEREQVAKDAGMQNWAREFEEDSEELINEAPIEVKIKTSNSKGGLVPLDQLLNSKEEKEKQIKGEEFKTLIENSGMSPEQKTQQVINSAEKASKAFKEQTLKQNNRILALQQQRDLHQRLYKEKKEEFQNKCDEHQTVLIDLEELQKAYHDLYDMNQKNNIKITELYNALTLKNKKIEEKEKERQDLKEHIELSDTKIEEYGETIEQQNKKINQLESKIVQLQTMDAQKEIERLHQVCRDKDSAINQRDSLLNKSADRFDQLNYKYQKLSKKHDKSVLNFLNADTEEEWNETNKKIVKLEKKHRKATNKIESLKKLIDALVKNNLKSDPNVNIMSIIELIATYDYPVPHLKTEDILSSSDNG